MSNKRGRQALRIAWKAAQLGVKLIFIRCFGIEGAACVLAGIVATAARLRGAWPKVRTFARRSGRGVVGALAMIRLDPSAKIVQETVGN